MPRSQRTLDNDRMVLAVEERVEELIGLFEREAYRLAPLKGADVSIEFPITEALRAVSEAR